ICTVERCAPALDVQAVMSSVQVTQENKRNFAAVGRLDHAGPKEGSLRGALRKICLAQVGARDPLKSRGLVRSGDGCYPAEGFQFVSENRARYPITVMCRILGVSPSGYYAWVKRPSSARALMDAGLTAKICAAHAASKGTYGAPRLRIDLA